MTTQPTDLMRAAVDGRAVLSAVADHFTANAPTEVLEQHVLLLAIGAEAYRLTDKSLAGGGQALAKQALALASELVPGTTRGEFALILRADVARAQWGDDADERVIPRLPRPRTEPVPADRPRIPAQPKEGER